MKKLLIIGLISLMLASCSTRSGHLTGVEGRRVYYPEVPLGMVYIPQGSYVMGQNDESVPFLHQSISKTVTISAFYMDQTEITNNEYRQFVHWVRDSIARRLIYENIEEDKEADRFINYQDEYYDEGIMEWVEYESSDRFQNIDNFSLNWDRSFSYQDPMLVPLLSEMYYPSAERFYKRKEFDVRKLNFKYYWIDIVEAARKGKVHIIPDGYDNQKIK